MQTLNQDAFGQPDAPGPGQHMCWIVDHSDDRVRGAVAWAEQGLAAGEQVVWVERAGNRGGFVAELERHGVAWRKPVGEGRLVVLQPQDALLVDGRFDVEARMALHAAFVRQALADGFPAVRMAAEAVPALGVIPDLDALLAYERGMEELTRTLPVSVMCFYDRPALGERLAPFVPVHGRGVVAPLLRMSSSPGAVRLSGEIDLSNSDLVGALLAGAEPRDGVVQIQLRDLRFVDVGGTAHIVALGRRLGPQVRVRVLDPPPQLARILEAGGFEHHLEVPEAAA
jgi:anti-anti-sigma regulatory factor